MGRERQRYITTKIFHRDPEFRARIEGNRISDAASRESVFGERVLQAQGGIDSKFWKEYAQKREIGTRTIATILPSVRRDMMSKSRADFYKLIEDPSILFGIAEEIESNLHLYHEFGALLKSANFDDIMLRLYARFHKIPDSFYLALLKNHERIMLTRKARYETIKKQWESGLNGRFRILLESYGVKYTDRRFDERFQQLEFYFRDPLLPKFRGGVHGYHNVETTDAIHVGVFAEPEQGEDVLDHEFMHAFAGFTFIKKEERVKSGAKATNQSLPRFESQKAGLRFDISFPQFSWMNEAVTEMLAMQLGGRTQSIYYPAERDLIQLLCKAGKREILFSLFVRAYFEHYDPRKKYGKRTRAWNTLHGAFQEAYDTGFLVRLDKCIRHEKQKYLDDHKKLQGKNDKPNRFLAQEHAVSQAIDLIKRDWRLIP